MGRVKKQTQPKEPVAIREKIGKNGMRSVWGCSVPGCCLHGIAAADAVCAPCACAFSFRIVSFVFVFGCKSTAFF